MQEVPAPSRELAFRSPGKGEVSQGVWRHERLGLSLPLGGAKILDVPLPGIALTSGNGAMFIASFVDEPNSQRARDGFVNGLLVGALGQKLPGRFSFEKRYEWKALEGAWSKAMETNTDVELPAATLHVRARVLELCSGQASLYVVGISGPPEAYAEVDAWLQGLTGTPAPPICKEP
jgi:hypothetical protein